MANDIIFFDFSKKGKDVLGIQDVPILSNDSAVKESIINLLYTRIGTRLMQPLYGVNIEKYLFEPIDVMTTNAIIYEIKNGLSRFEDRIDDIEVDVIPDELLSLYTVNISYSVIYTTTIDSIQLTFNKVR